MSDPAPQSQATVIDYSSTVPAAASHEKAAINSIHWTVFPVKHLQEEANTKIILLHNKEKKSEYGDTEMDSAKSGSES